MAVIHNWIPKFFVESILGRDNLIGVILYILVGISIYADIFGTIPIGEALLAKGAMLETILVFIMGVTTLSLQSLIMLKKAIKWKWLWDFVFICSVGIGLVGYFFNGLEYLFF